MFILIAVVIGAGIVVALVYLLKQGKDNKDDEPKYGMQNIEDDNSFSKKRKRKQEKIDKWGDPKKSDKNDGKNGKGYWKIKI